MGNMGKLLMLFTIMGLFGLFFFYGCVQVPVVRPTEIALNKVGNQGELDLAQNSWQILDYTDLGVWAIGIRESSLNQHIHKTPFYGLLVLERTFPILPNPIAPEILQLVLPDTVPYEDILGSTVVSLFALQEDHMPIRHFPPLRVADVTIELPEAVHGTNQYQMTLEDYIRIRQPRNPFLFQNNQLFTPSFVHSNEKNIYTIRQFLEAKRMTDTSSVSEAFMRLKNRTEEEHKEILSFLHPNRVRIINDAIQVLEPDLRQRIRQLGKEGDQGFHEAEDVYTLIDNESNAEFLVQFKKSNLPENYQDFNYWKATIREKGFLFEQLDQSDIYQIIVPYSVPSSWELIRNGRFEGTTPSEPSVELIHPQPGSIIEALQVNLEWQGVPGVIDSPLRSRTDPEIVEYLVYFAPVAEPDYPEPESTTDTTMLKTDLAYDSQYKWKVVAIQNDNQTGSSMEATFQTFGAAPDGQEEVDAAILLVDEIDSIESLVVPGGACASQEEKERAIKEYLENLEGMAELGVTIEVVWNPQNGNYTVIIRKGNAEETTSITVESFVDSDPDQTSVDAAIDLVEDKDPIGELELPGGAGASQAEKEAAVKKHLEELAGMGDLGVTITVAWNAGNGNYDVTITKGDAEEATTIEVTAYKDSEPDQTDVSKAIAKVETASPIEEIAVSGGPEAEQTDKENAVKAFLEGLDGMADLGVSIEVAWDAVHSKYITTITKGEAQEVTSIIVTSYKDSTPDLTAVNKAKEKVEAADPIAELEVLGGESALPSLKEAAVKKHLEELTGMGDLGVTIAVAWNGGTGEYDVTITKGAEEEATTIAVLLYIDANPDQTDVMKAIAKVEAVDPIEKLEVVGGDGADQALKEAAVKAFLEGLESMSILGVTIGVQWKEGTGNYDVTITKGIATWTTSISVSEFTEPSEFGGGDGSESQPYLISNWEHLHNVRNNLSAHYRLENDLDESSPGYDTYASGTADGGYGWMPIGSLIAAGNYSNSFIGVFDGNGKTIKGIRINRPTEGNVGLFGHVGNNNESHVTTIKDLGIEDIQVSGARGTGTLIGRVTGTMNTTVINCYAIDGNVTGDGAVGGLIGSFNSYESNPANAPGRRPRLIRSYANIEVFFSGSGTGKDKFGGLVGCSQKGLISNSYATGPVTADGCQRVGGLVGCVENRGYLEFCYSIGKVQGDGSTLIGGLLGFLGTSHPGNVVNCYWDTQTSEWTTSADGIGKTTAEMTQGAPSPAIFTNWDIGVWSFTPTDAYPWLLWQGVAGEHNIP